MNEGTHTYAIRNDHMITRKDGEVVQSGGDRYAIYISNAEISKEDFFNLKKENISEQEIAQRLTTKYGETVLLSGSIILKRGTHFDSVRIYSEDNGDTKISEEEQDIITKLTKLVKLSNEQAQEVNQVQEHLNAAQNKLNKTQSEISELFSMFEESYNSTNSKGRGSK